MPHIVIELYQIELKMHSPTDHVSTDGRENSSILNIKSVRKANHVNEQFLVLAIDRRNCQYEYITNPDALLSTNFASEMYSDDDLIN
jgi:hypothetical protein